jgi:hypothetical protein
VIFDRDSIFSAQVIATLRSFGIEPTRTAYRSPGGSALGVVRAAKRITAAESWINRRPVRAAVEAALTQ